MARSTPELILGTACRFIETLGWQANPEIVGIFVIGSVAEGRCDSGSDLDLVVVTDDVPTTAERVAAYAAIGAEDIIGDFLSAEAFALRSNVVAIDKLRLGDIPVDVAICRPEQMQVYAHLTIMPLKWLPMLRPLPGPERTSRVPSAYISNRIEYALRVMRVHTDRYRRWTARGNWLAVDTSLYLRAARDILLVRGGIWCYNEMNVWMWDVVKESPYTTPETMCDILDVKLLDDRQYHIEKGRIMERLLDDLRAMYNQHASGPNSGRTLKSVRSPENPVSRQHYG